MPKKNVFFRADGNSEIGLGHIVRSLALADMLKDDFNCMFATRFADQYVKDEIAKTCTNFIKLNEDGNFHLEEFLAYVPPGDIVVLDNYFFSTDYQKEIKKKGCKLVCVDDMHNKHYVADFVINHGTGQKKENFSIEPYTKLLLGQDYALLRKPFLDIAHRKRTKLERCLVCIGGADTYNLTTFVVTELEKLGQIKIVDIVIGPAFLHESKLNGAISTSTKEINVLKGLSASEMAQSMQIADFGVFPASSVSFEAMAVGLPFLVGYYAENQKEQYFNMTKKNPEIGLGYMREMKRGIKIKSSLLNQDRIDINLYSEIPKRYIKAFKSL